MTADHADRGQHLLSLCDYSGNMVRPWARAGYQAIAVDMKHDGDTVEEVGDGSIRYVKADVLEYEPPAVDYAAAFAFPPCTDLAVSGAKHFKDKGLSALADAFQVVAACQETVSGLDCPWMLENPVSTLSTYWREPDWKFDPYQYDGYTDQDEAYTKKTWLWTGGGFQMPVTKGTDESEADDRIHTMAPTDDRSEKRAATPTGFARAVFLAHHDPEQYARVGGGQEQTNLQDVIA